MTPVQKGLRSQATSIEKKEERAKFLEDVDRRGPPVLWVRYPCQKRPDLTCFSIEASARQHRRHRPYVLHVPLGCNICENKQLEKLLDEANGKIYLMKSGSVVTNCDRIQTELEREHVDVEHVKDRVVKLTETTSKERTDDVQELHQCCTLDDPVVSWDLQDQWDEIAPLEGAVFLCRGRSPTTALRAHVRVTWRASARATSNVLDTSVIVTRAVQTGN